MLSYVATATRVFDSNESSMKLEALSNRKANRRLSPGI